MAEQVMRWMIGLALLFLAGCQGQDKAEARAGQWIGGQPPGGLSGARGADRFFITSDGVSLHYLEAGPASAPTLVLVPGWTMPAWIFQPQIEAFSARYHVVAFDPRGQGKSDVPPTGYEPMRRGQDIAELIGHLGPRPVAVLGWSLGVLDTLAYIHTHGDARVAALILVDNSIGENPPPPPHRPHPPGPPIAHDIAMAHFVRTMFRTPQPEEYLDRLADATLHTPEQAARDLLSYPLPRTYWREAVYMTNKPILYLVRPGLAGQANNLQLHDPEAETRVLTGVGHAMFVDDPGGFDALVGGFLQRRVWSGGN
jgi:microsomal epoxide hydrolase